MREVFIGTEYTAEAVGLSNDFVIVSVLCLLSASGDTMKNL